ncbi:protein PTHB1-like [Ciona intestinalis]
MSLFQTHELWRSKNTSDEECGFGCLSVANIDNSSDGSDKVIVGSYHGVVHIYSPTPDLNHAHDVLLEVDLNLPILQIEAGRFISVSSDLHLAVLHPRILAIYKISVSEGAVDHGHQYSMSKLFQHALERTSMNMTTGCFGGAHDRDYICVQSIDGSLSLFESESFIFTRFLPRFLLPGPLVFNPRTDSFITISSANFLESYSYQVLAVATDVDKKDEKQRVSTGKKISVDWSFNLGENGIDLQVVQINDKSNVIMVLGERSIFCMDEGGGLKFMLKLDYNVACFHAYSCNGAVVTLVCTHSQQLLVYDVTKLRWAARLGEVPVQILRGNFNDTPGILVTLTDTCSVRCTYLGTSPSMFMVPRSKDREVDTDNLQLQISKLNQTIQLHHSKGGDLSSKKEANDLSIQVNVAKSIDKKSAAKQLKHCDVIIPSVSLQLSLKSTRRVSEVQIVFDVKYPIHSTVTQLNLRDVDPDHPYTTIASLYLTQPHPPSSLIQEVSVYFNKPSGTPHVITTHFTLPLSLVVKPASPVKKMDHKVTLETDVPCVNLMDLFPEFCQSDSGPSCIGFEYFHGAKATILTSKSSNRYRVQCDIYDGLWLVTNELVRRLNDKNIEVTTQESPNLSEYFDIVDQHYLLRVGCEELTFGLEQRAQQYRAIQRRLLTRFKDKTPSSLNCLDTLLEGTHLQLMSLADALVQHDERTRISSNILSSASLLLALMVKLWSRMGDQQGAVLRGAFCVEQTYNKHNSPGWEEMVEASMTSLLKMFGENVGESSLKFPENTKKLKKRISAVIDKINKGGKISTKHRNNIKTDIPGSGERTNDDKENFLEDFSSESFNEGLPEVKVQTPKLPEYQNGISFGESPTEDTTKPLNRDVTEIESPAFYEDYNGFN